MDDILKDQYDKIDILVMQYQNGDEQAAQELIEQLDPYLKKYVKIIKDNLINLNDKDSRRFIALFVNDSNARKGLIKKYQPNEARNKAYKSTLMLSSMCNNITYEDLTQELTCILLTMAKRYKKKGKKINFCGYLYSSFRYEVYRTISKWTLDPLVHNSGSTLRFNECSFVDEDNDVESDGDIYIEELTMLLDDDLGNSWIRGLTCGEEFEELTPIERLILRMKYQEGKTDVEIADRLQLHRNTIRAQRLKAIDKIKYYG